MQIVNVEQLRKLSINIFKKVGATDEEAGIVSDYIVDSHLYGHDTHGVISIPRFVEDIRVGKIHPNAKIEVLKRGPGTAIVDGHWGFGYVTATKTMELAIEIANANGISAVSLMNCNHIGMLWGYAKMAVDKGLIGMVACSSGPQGGLVVPYGGTRRFLGANPLAFGIPAEKMKPLIMDISTSIVAGGKVLFAEQKGEKIPEGWILTKDGNPTTEPKDFLERGGALLPFGGYKGYGLGLLIEILGSILTGYGCAYLPDYREGNGTFMIVIDINRFVPLEVFRKNVDDLFRKIKEVPTDTNTKEIMIPGELEFMTRKIREREGISIPDKTWEMVISVAKEFGVDESNL